jgi:hypothetical protein
MSMASLLYWRPPPMQDETFGFEHAMAHRGLMGSMSPLNSFSIVPYVLDPGLNHDDWHRDHTQAHADFQGSFPGIFHYQFPVPTGSVVGFLGPAYNIEDYDVDNHESRTWWTFQNHYAHLNAASVQNLESLVFPFF